MAYAAPLGNDIQFNFTAGGYTAPAGGALALDFQSETLDFSHTASGGVLVGGTAPDEVSFTFTEAGSGGVLVGGAAEDSLFIPPIYDEMGTGGVLVGGAADEVFTGSLDFVGSGGVLVGGVAPNEAAYVYTEEGTGGVRVGGAAEESVLYPSVWDEVGAGGVTLGGTALETTLIHEDVGGGVRVGGSAVIANYNVMDYLDIGSGGIRLGGSAAAEFITPAIAVVLPRPNADLDANFTDYISARFAKTIWASSTAQVGASLEPRLPALRADSSLLVGVSGGVDVRLPAAGVTLAGGENLVDGLLAYLPPLRPALEAVAGGVGALDVRLPALRAVPEGYTTVRGTLGLTLPSLRPAVAGLAGQIGRLAATLYRPRTEVQALLGVAGALDVTLPAPAAEAEGYTQVSGAVEVRLPSPSALLDAEQARQLVAALCMNTITPALSEFTGYDFNSFCEFGGAYYAAGPGGLYRLDAADTDDGTPIEARISTGDLDFGEERQKRITDFYIGMRAQDDLLLRVATDEGEPFEYTLQTFGVERLKQRRVPTGKGARGKYWRFELENTGGGDFEIDTMNITVVPVARRI